MKRQSIFLILLLLQVLLICVGCGSTDKSAGLESPAAAAEEAAAVTEEAAEAEAAAQAEASDSFEIPAPVVDVIGIFEGLEDNHTAIFSFDGAETAFHFEDAGVQQVLYEAALGSPYTLSYEYNDSLGYVIYEISE